MKRIRVRLAIGAAAMTLVAAVTVSGAASASGSRDGASRRPFTTTGIDADAVTSAMAVLRTTANRIGIGDPDRPPVGGPIDEGTYLRLRAEQEAKYRGAPFDLPYNGRVAAIRVAARETAAIDAAAAGRASTAAPAWTPIGPAPIPNGDTFPSKHAVSGRATAIAIDPTNANVVYVGTAQGGLYRTVDGGAHWTPVMDGAASLAIGALALSADGSHLYVGTGEGTMAIDSFAGVGLYRIDTPSGAFSLHGPFEQRVAGTGTAVGNGHAFQFDSIAGIAVDPTNADRIYLAVTRGFMGDGAYSISGRDPAAELGLYRSTNATTATPTFSKVAGGLPTDTASNRFGGSDVMFLPGNSSTLLVGILDATLRSVANDGVFRTTTADQASPVFTQVTMPNTVYSVRFAASAANPSTVVAAGYASVGGRVYGSTDGGATFPTTFGSANGFCGGQCFFDVAAAVDPSNANNMLVGGSVKSGGGASPMIRSTDGSTFSYSGDNLHADTHAVAFAPSNPSVVYTADDGGIFKSTDGGAGWVSLNTPDFSATQFESIAVHPINPSFTIGGTQDNGTELRGVGGEWQRVDYSDGGFALIDQNATSARDLTMYHTYYNASGSLVGYVVATSTPDAHDGGWTFRGCNLSMPNNGIDCSESPQFYPPLALGPGDPNTVYFGTNVLHRSADEGVTNPVVSQQMGCGITAIGISPVNDNVRVVGDLCGQAFGTTTGSSTLSFLNVPKPPNTTPYVSRVVFDPTDPNTVYVTEDSYAGGTGPGYSHVWKTSNLNGNPPTWVDLDGNGTLPDVPVNAFAIDPISSQHLYAGTDIGVFASMDGGASWAPFGTGLPRVAVFDMAIASPGTTSEVLRIATHGRGMWETLIGTTPPDTTPPPTPNIATHPAAVTKQTSASFGFSDAQQSATLWCSLDNGPVTACSSPKTFNALSDGTHTFRVVADDAVLNESNAATFSWLVDTVPPPTPNIGTHPAAATNQNSASFGFSDTEAGVAIKCSLDNASATACSSPVTLNSLSDGMHTFKVLADDAALNESSSTFSWLVDTVPPPTPNIDTHPDAVSTQASASFGFSDTEGGVTLTCSLDNAAAAACSSPVTLNSLSDGMHTFKVSADDAALNESSATFSWLVDATPPPTPNIGTHPAAATNQTSASFGFSDSEAGVTLRCSLDNAPAAGCSSPVTFHSLSDGTHTFKVSADDAVLHESSTTFTWQVDTKPPVATMNRLESVARALGFPVQWTGKDDADGTGVASYDVRVRQAPFDGIFGAFSPMLVATTATSTTGGAPTGTTACYSVRAQDAAGNRSPYSAERCTAVPFDDQAIAPSAGWTRKHDQPGAFLGTLSIAKARGANLVVGGVHVRQVAIVVQRCAACGVVDVLFGTTRIGSIDTRGSGFAVLASRALPSLKTGSITLRVASSGKPVKVDAVAILRTAPLKPA